MTQAIVVLECHMDNHDERVRHLVPPIDELWGALESDDDLITADEIALVDARLSAWREKATECVPWERVSAYITSRPKTPIKSS